VGVGGGTRNGSPSWSNRIALDYFPFDCRSMVEVMRLNRLAGFYLVFRSLFPPILLVMRETLRNSPLVFQHDMQFSEVCHLGVLSLSIE
jgi:hypothetical protein